MSNRKQTESPKRGSGVSITVFILLQLVGIYLVIQGVTEGEAAENIMQQIYARMPTCTGVIVSGLGWVALAAGRR